MICIVIYYEITEEKTNGFVLGRTIVSSQYHLMSKLMHVSCKHECLGDLMVVTDPILARMYRVWWL